MSMINCLECGHEISDLAKTCPKCGAGKAAAVGISGERAFFSRVAGLVTVILSIGAINLALEAGVPGDGVIFAGMGVVAGAWMLFKRYSVRKRQDYSTE